MIEVQCFVFNPFEENTYVVYDGSGECIIIDPGCYTNEEQLKLRWFVEDKGLKPVRLINTHCHLDHVFGNRFVFNTWKLLPEIHRDELKLLEQFTAICRQYGIPDAEASPNPARFIEAGETITFGKSSLETRLTPGHSPASLSFYSEADAFVIAGDVLFFESIGRTDLPGGNFDTLIASIRDQLFVLPDATLVFPGHGPTTTIRHEKEYNPFL